MVVFITVRLITLRHEPKDNAMNLIALFPFKFGQTTKILLPLGAVVYPYQQVTSIIPVKSIIAGKQAYFFGKALRTYQR